MPLDTAFWSYAVMGGVAVNVLTSFAFMILVVADKPVAGFIVGYGLSLPYNLIAIMGVCRAAAQDDADPAKAKLYPFVTIAGMVLLSVT